MKQVFLKTSNPQDGVSKALKINKTVVDLFSTDMLDVIGQPRFYNYVRDSIRKNGKNFLINSSIFEHHVLDEEDEKLIAPDAQQSLKTLAKQCNIPRNGANGKPRTKKEYKLLVQTAAAKKGLLSKGETTSVYKQRKQQKLNKFNKFRKADRARDLSRVKTEFIEPSFSTMDYHMTKLREPDEPKRNKKKLRNKKNTKSVTTTQRNSGNNKVLSRFVHLDDEEVYVVEEEKGKSPGSSNTIKKTSTETNRERYLRKTKNRENTANIVASRKARRDRRAQRKAGLIVAQSGDADDLEEKFSADDAVSEFSFEEFGGNAYNDENFFNASVPSIITDSDDDSLTFDDLGDLTKPLFKHKKIVAKFLDIAVLIHDIVGITDSTGAAKIFYRAVRLFNIDDAILNNFSSVRKVWDQLVNKLLKSPVPKENIPVESGVLDTVECMMARMQMVMSGDLGTAIGCLLTMLGGISIAGIDLSEISRKYFPKTKRMTTFAIFCVSVSVLIKLIRFGKSYFAGNVTFAEMLETSDPLGRALSRSEYFLSRSDNTYIDSPIEGFSERMEFISEVKAFIKDCQVFDDWPLTYDTVSRLRINLERLKMVASKLEASLTYSREMPFAFVLFGTAGLGKTNIRKFLLSALYQAAGLKYSEASVYTKSMCSEYWDGIEPNRHKTVFLPELANQSTGIAKRESVAAMADFHRLVDTAPFNANMSEAHLKGTVYPAPLFVVGETNNEGLHLNEQVYDKAALLRRFIFVEIKLKPDYAQDQSTQMDYKKSIAAGGNLLNRYVCEVFKHVVTGTNKVTKKTVSRGGIVTAAKALVRLYQFHDESQKSMSDMQHHIDDALQLVFLKRKFMENEDDDLFSDVDQDEKIDEDQDYFNGPVNDAEAGEADDILDEEYKPEEKSELDKIFPDAIDFREAVSEEGIRPWLIRSRLMFQKKEQRVFSGQTPLIYDGVAAHIGFNIFPFMFWFLVVASFIEEFLRYIFFLPFTVVLICFDIQAGRSIANTFIVHLPAQALMFFCGIWGFWLALLLHITYNVGLYYFYEYIPQIHNLFRFTPANVALNSLLYVVEDLRTRITSYIINVIRLDAEQLDFLDKSPKFYTNVLVKMSFIFFIFLLTLFTLFYYYFYKCMVITILMFSICLASLLSINYKRMFYLVRMKGTIFGEEIINREAAIYVPSPWFNNSVVNLFTVRNFEFLAMAIASGAIATILFRKLRSKKKHIKQEGGEGLNMYEDALNATTGIYRVKVDNTNAWNHIKVASNEASHYGSPQELETSIFKSNVYRFLYYDEKIGKTMTSFALGLKKSYVVLNLHTVVDTQEFLFKMTGDKAAKTKDKDSDLLVKFGRDCIVAVDEKQDIAILNIAPHNVRDIMKHIVESDSHIKFAVGSINTKPVQISHKRDLGFQGNNEEFTITHCYAYKAEHYPGMCGTPLIAAVGQSLCAIVGIHAGGLNETGYSTALRRTTLEMMMAGDKEDLLHPIQSEGGLPVETSAPGPKSQSRYLPMPNIDLFGKVDGISVTFPKKSNIRYTPLAKDLDELFSKHFDHKQEEDFLRPLMKPGFKIIGDESVYVDPYRTTLTKLDNNPPSLNRKLMRKIVKQLSSKLTKMFRDKGIQHLTPLTATSAINGAEHDGFVRRINASTSGGFGFPGVKSKHLTIVDGLGNREMTPELNAMVSEHLARYISGETCRPIYKAQLKDEPRLRSKVEKGSTRVFYMSPLPNLIISRMMLGTFISSMVDFGKEIGIQVGIDMHTDIQRYFEQTPWPTGFEGDYSGYDVRRSPDLQYMVNSVIYQVHKNLGYNQTALRVLAGLLTDDCGPLFIMLGELYRKMGAQMSGKYGTAEQNSIAGLCIAMYNFYSNPDTEDLDFFQNVFANTYGDDVQMSVVSTLLESGRFDGRVFQALTRKNFDMDFTSPAKGLELERSITLTDGSFLKRTFFYDDNTQRWKAKLDLNSIYKALQYFLPSKSTSEEDQVISCIQNLLWEFYFHVTNEKQYISLRNDLVDLYCEAYHVNGEDVLGYLPTYTSIKHRTGDVVVPEPEESDLGFAESGPADSPVGYLAIFDKFQRHETITLNEVVDYAVCNGLLLHMKTQELENIMDDLHKQLRTLNDEKDDADIYTLRSSNDHLAPDRRARIKRLAAIADVEETIKVFNRLRRKRIVAQSGAAEASEGEVKSNVEEEHGVLRDVAGNVPNTINETSARYINNGQTTMYDLDDFFERPVEIASYAIPLVTDSNVVLDVWDMYTLDPTVRSKLNRYAYLHGDLHIRIAVTGTPFHYGRLLVSYQPYAQRNANLIAFDSLVFTEPTTRSGLLTYLSQSPEVAIINVNKNEPVDLVLPFISTKQAHRLYNDASTVISDVTSFDDLQEAGSLYIYTLNPVSAVTADASTVYVQVYAWMESPDLGCTTATQMAIQTQSGSDERKTGPIEKYSSAAASISGKLEGVPIIGPFAQASTHIFRGISGIASIFGWSKPVILDEHKFVKNEAYNNACITIGATNCHKLSLDPLQETSLGSEVVGIYEDETSIRYLCSKETYIGSFIWDPLDAIMADPIYLTRIHPDLSNWVETLTAPYVFPSTMAFCSRFFERWRGSITIKFEFVVSAYHRGKVAFFYEPNISQAALINANLSLNKNSMYILDLQETQCISFCVNWNASRPTLRCTTPGASKYNNYVFSPTLNAVNYVNGYMGVVPFTELTSPDNSAIEVNVYVSSDDMDFFIPSDKNREYGRIMPESGEIKDNASVSCIDLNYSTAAKNDLYKQYFGERVVSFRQLMKRWVTRESYDFGVGLVGDVSVKATRLRMPVQDLQYGATSFTNSPTVYTRIQYAYLGMRGSTRRRIRFAVPDGTAVGDAYVVSNTQSGTTEGSSWSTNYQNLGLIGSTMFLPRTNGGAEVDFPYYSPNLFEFAFADDHVGSNIAGDMEEEYVSCHQVSFNIRDNTLSPVYVEDFCIGEDFNFLRFQGAPFYSN